MIVNAVGHQAHACGDGGACLAKAGDNFQHVVLCIHSSEVGALQGHHMSARVIGPVSAGNELAVDVNCIAGRTDGEGYITVDLAPLHRGRADGDIVILDGERQVLQSTVHAVPVQEDPVLSCGEVVQICIGDDVEVVSLVRAGRYNTPGGAIFCSFTIQSNISSYAGRIKDIVFKEDRVCVVSRIAYCYFIGKFAGYNRHVPARCTNRICRICLDKVKIVIQIFNNITIETFLNGNSSHITYRRTNIFGVRYSE